jgi:hypothetical protein
MPTRREMALDTIVTEISHQSMKAGGVELENDGKANHNRLMDTSKLKYLFAPKSIINDERTESRFQNYRTQIAHSQIVLVLVCDEHYTLAH